MQTTLFDLARVFAVMREFEVVKFENGDGNKQAVEAAMAKTSDDGENERRGTRSDRNRK